MSKILERLKARGIPAEDLEYLERQLGRAAKADEVEQEARTYRERFAYLQGAASGGGGKKQQSKFDQFVEQFKSHENAEELRQIFGGLREVILEEAEERAQKKVAPLQERMGELTTARQLDEYLETKLVPLYGDGIREWWDKELRAKSLKELRETGQVIPEMLALELDEGRVTELLSAKRKKSKQVSDARTQEGFQTIERHQPSMSSGGRDDDEDEPGRGEERDGKGRFALKKFDANAVAADVMRLMGKGPAHE